MNLIQVRGDVDNVTAKYRNKNTKSKKQLNLFRYVVMVAMLLHALNASLTLYATFQVNCKDDNIGTHIKAEIYIKIIIKIKIQGVFFSLVPP